MKTRVFQKVLAVTVLSLLAMLLPAQDTPVASPPPQLSFGVSDIIKLSQAKLSDDTIIQFINALGDDYALTADQIIYLRQQGVSEAVIKVMLHSRGGTAATIPPPVLNFTPSAAPVAATASQPQPDLLSEPPPADISSEVAQPPGTVTILSPVEPLQPTFADSGPPAVVYVQPAPAYYPVYGGYYGGGASFVTVSSGNFYGRRVYGGFHGGGGFHNFGHSAGHFGGGGFHH